jgi:hypothetical protein
MSRKDLARGGRTTKNGIQEAGTGPEINQKRLGNQGPILFWEYAELGDVFPSHVKIPTLTSQKNAALG